MVEFTGERIVPGKIDDDLFHQHRSRYAFAAHLANGRRCLDAGCGVGYGTELLAQSGASMAIGIDIHAATIFAAAESSSQAATGFLIGDVSELPFQSQQFDLIASFEVIEHLRNWADYLAEITRLLSDEGIYIVSTPNKDYYAISRGDSGPNPYHEHEFTFDEFRNALAAHFSEVHLFAQNEVPAFLFMDERSAVPPVIRLSEAPGNVASAEFYVAVCSQQPVQDVPSFAYLTSSGNVLLERAKHINLLSQELHLKAEWLETAQSQLAELQKAHTRLQHELDERSDWAIAATSQLQTENRRLADELDAKCMELDQAVRNLNAAEATVVERSAWAGRLNQHIEELAARISQYEQDISDLSTSVTGRKRTLLELTTELKAMEMRRNAELRSLAERLHISASDHVPTYEHILAEVERCLAALERSSYQLEGVRHSRWLRLGRLIGLGPNLEDEPK